MGIDIQVSQLEALIPSSNGKLIVVPGSIPDRSTSEQAITAAVEARGRLDTIILNAGVLKPVGRLADTDIDDWKKLFDVNFFGLLHTVSPVAHAFTSIDGVSAILAFCFLCTPR